MLPDLVLADLDLELPDLDLDLDLDRGGAGGKKSVAKGVEGTVEVEGPGRGSIEGKSKEEKSRDANGERCAGAGAETLEGDLRGAC